MKRSKVAELIRFIGRYAIRGWARLKQTVVTMWRTHQKRTWLERSLLGVVAVGLVAGVGFTLLASLPFGGAPIGNVPAPLEEIAAGDGSRGAGADLGLDVPVQPIAGAQGVSEASEAAVGLQGIEQSLSMPDLTRQTTGAERPETPGGPTAGPEGGVSGEDRPAPAPSASPQSAAPPAAPLRPDVPTASVSSMEWPVVGGMLQPYGWYRHPVFGDWRHASSVVLQPAADQKQVTSALAGRVSDVVNSGGRWRVTIRHSGGWETEYDGLASVDVASFEVVATGQVIGSASDGSPQGVAFAVYHDGVAVDPSEILGEPTAMVGAP